MITIEQMKAARSLIGWKQSDLAKSSGISLAAINNIERGSSSPRAATMALIEQTFQRAGVDFIDGPGVRIRQEIFEVINYEGRYFFDDLTKDIMRILKPGDSIRIFSSGEKFIRKYSSDHDAAYQNFVQAYDIDEQIIVRDDEAFFISRLRTYRFLPRDYIGKTYWLVYGDRVAFVLWEKPHRAMIIHNPALAETYKKQFSFMWRLAKSRFT